MFRLNIKNNIFIFLYFIMTKQKTKNNSKDNYISNIIYKHIKKSFKELDFILKNTKYKVKFPFGNNTTNININSKKFLTNKNIVNLGTGLAENQWYYYVKDTKKYIKMLNIINIEVNKLCLKYPEKVIFGNIHEKYYTKNVIRIFGANSSNWNLDEQTKIIGNGQAKVIGTQNFNVFGIVTTPVSGVSHLLEKRKSLDFIKNKNHKTKKKQTHKKTFNKI